MNESLRKHLNPLVYSSVYRVSFGSSAYLHVCVCVCEHVCANTRSGHALNSYLSQEIRMGRLLGCYYSADRVEQHARSEVGDTLVLFHGMDISARCYLEVKQ